MKVVRCETLQELREAIEAAGPDALYRGQVTHYERLDGSPSLTTTFARHGCVPDLMLRWYYHARHALRRYVVGWVGTNDLATDQAILQHYGWRSFFLDATGSPGVGAWFASHEFRSNKRCELVEDCFEDPVFLVWEEARFDSSEGDGHLYVISRKALRTAGIGAVHLSEIATASGTPRYVRQDAYMVGPVDEIGLAPGALAAHIIAPKQVLAAYAGEMTCEGLFPEPHEDPIFAELLAMPWEKVPVGDGAIDFFRRSLALPEYSSHLRKHMSPTAAMYRNFWLVDMPKAPEEELEFIHVLCGSALYYGSSALRFKLPLLSSLISRSDGLVIETDGLVFLGMGTRYGKGVMVEKKSTGLVHVCELGVDHPGLQIHGIGKFPGMHYRIDPDGSWHRVVVPEDCDCGSDGHDGHVRLLGRIEESIVDGYIAQDASGAYVQRGISRQTDSAVLRDAKAAALEAS